MERENPSKKIVELIREVRYTLKDKAGSGRTMVLENVTNALESVI